MTSVIVFAGFVRILDLRLERWLDTMQILYDSDKLSYFRIGFDSDNYNAGGCVRSSQ